MLVWIKFLPHSNTMCLSHRDKPVDTLKEKSLDSKNRQKPQNKLCRENVALIA